MSAFQGWDECLFVHLITSNLFQASILYFSTLVVRKGKPEDVVCDLITQLGSVSAVVFHEEVRETLE